jgi:YVTN family beta-propeller protein
MIRHIASIRSVSSRLHVAILLSVLPVVFMLCSCQGIGGKPVSVNAGPNPTPAASPSPTPVSAATTYVYMSSDTLLRGAVGKVFTLNANDGSIGTLDMQGIPRAVAISGDGKLAYVTILDLGNVAVIDTASNSIVATIPVGKTPETIALTPNGRFAYVTNTGDGTISVIDTLRRAVTNTIFTDSAPWGITFSRDGSQAYVPLLDFGNFHIGGPHPENALAVIDTATQTLASKLPLVTGEAIAASPVRDEIYLTEGNFGVYVISTETNQVVARIDLNTTDELKGVAVSPDGERIYVTAHGSIDIGHVDPPNPTVPAAVYVISAPERTVLAKVNTDPGLMDIVLDAEGKTAYLRRDETSISGLQTFDTQSLTFGSVQTFAADPLGIAVGRR